MKIAIPMNGDEMSMHFGHCEKFRVYEVENDAVRGTEDLTPPPHEPGVLPKFLAEKGVNCILAGGMGQRAQQLFSANGIQVMVGVNGQPNDIIAAYLKGELQGGANICDH